MLVRGLGTALAFLTHVVLARTMGAEQYGAFIYVYAWTYFLGLLARLGFDRAAVRFGTAFIGSGDLAAYASLIRHSFRVALALGLAAGLTMGAVAIFVPFGLSPVLTDTFLYGVMLVPLLSVHNVYEGIAQAQKDVLRATVPEQVLRQSLLGALVALAALGPGRVSAPQGMVLYAIAVVITLGVEWAWYRRTRPPGLADVVPGPVNPEWFGYAAQVSAATLVGSWILQADLMVVGALLGAESASLYSVASRIASLVAWIGVAAGLVFGPIIVELGVGRPHGGLQHYSRLVARGMAAGAIALAGLLWFTRDAVLGLFGPAFLPAAAPLAILLVGNVLRECFGPAFPLLNFSGLQKPALLILAIAAAFNIVANFTLTDRLGMVGAALATAATVVGYSAAFWHVLRRQLGIDSGALSIGLASPPRM